MLTALTFQTNIRAEPDNRPLVGAAGVRLAQAQVIFHLQIWKHGEDYTAVNPPCSREVSPDGDNVLVQMGGDKNIISNYISISTYLFTFCNEKRGI